MGYKFISAALAVLVCAAAGCAARTSSASPFISPTAWPSFTAPAATSTQAPSATATPSPASTGYLTIPVSLDYQAIPPIHPENAKEIQIELPEEMSQPQVVAMPGGGALALGQMVPGDGSRSGPSTLIAARYDTKGRLLWTKVYAELPEGYAGSLRPLGTSNGYEFTFLISGDMGSGVQGKATIVICGKDGHVTHQESSMQPLLFQYVFAIGNGIAAIGDGFYSGGKLTGDPTQPGLDEALTISVQGNKSLAFFSRKALVKGISGISAAIWSKQTGLVLAAYRKAADGSRSMGILAFDLRTLKQKWQYLGEEQGNATYNGLYATKGGILASGFDAGKPFILKLNGSGKKLWEIAPDGDGEYSMIAMAALPGGGFAAAINRYDGADTAKGEYLALYDMNGSQTKRIKLPHETLGTIQPTDDGGLLTVGIQGIQALPQPPYVNSIWMDTETIVTKYDKDRNIQWRKVYDRYQDSTRQDIAVPEADGGVIVEK